MFTFEYRHGTLEKMSKTIAELTKRVNKTAEERGWGKYGDGFESSHLAMSISIEAAEVLEHFQWGRGNNPETNNAVLGEELADVMIYCLELADALEIDLSAAILDKVAKNEAKYPVQAVKGHDERYWQIKYEVRDERAGKCK